MTTIRSYVREIRIWMEHGCPGPEAYLGAHDTAGRLGEPMVPRSCMATFTHGMRYYVRYLIEGGKELGTAGEFRRPRALRLANQQVRAYLVTRRPGPAVDESVFLAAIRRLRASLGRHARETEVIMYLAYYCGLRLRDITYLRWGDIDWSFGVIVLNSPKYSRPYRVFIPWRLRAALEELRARRREAPLAEDYVFPRADGGPRDPCTIWRWLRGLGITPHALRRGCVTHLVRSGVPIEIVAKIMNHSSLQTTLGYVSYTDGEIRNAVEGAVLNEE